MTRCSRCGDRFERHTADQRYCDRCARDVQERTAVKTTWMPTWRQVARAKDLSGQIYGERGRDDAPVV